MVNTLSYLSYDCYNKDRDLCYYFYGVVHIKDPPANGK